MTIIAVCGDTMAADSVQYCGSLVYPVLRPKITRAPDGSLVGGAGLAVDTTALRDWVAAGMDFKATPSLMFPSESEESLEWIWLKPDETVWIGDAGFRVHQVASPASIGMRDARHFVAGVMAVRAAAGVAVRLAIEHCVWIGGKVQVETLADHGD